MIKAKLITFLKSAHESHTDTLKTFSQTKFFKKFFKKFCYIVIICYQINKL